MNLEAYVRATLTDLVRTPSTPDADMSDILRVARACMEDLGLRVRLHEDVRALEASSGAGGVLFNGHLDTVPVADGWTREPGRIEGDILFGRGTADMKGGCVAALAAARILLDRGVPFSLLFTTDEETTMKGAVQLAPTDAVRTAAAVVVGEPSGLKVIASEKGILWYHATTRGRTAHGSLPHLGDNAIFRMARILRQLEAHARPKSPLEEITMNLGTIRGGSTPNVVADRCSVDIDCRYPPGKSREDVEGLLRLAFRAAGEEADLELFHEVPAAGIPKDAPHIRLLRDLAGTEVVGVTYGTEMAHYARQNPRCVVFGPGAPEMCHVPDEHVAFSEAVRAAEILAEFATRMNPPGGSPARTRTKSSNTPGM